jgi:antitoxin HicB
MPEPDGSFRAEIIEFPGCIALADTASEALAKLEEVALSWLDVVLAKGQTVPDPIEGTNFSGKLVVRMPKSLHKKAAHLAARDGVSLNQFILASLAENVGERSAIFAVGALKGFVAALRTTETYHIQTSTDPLALPSLGGKTLSIASL